MRISSTIDRRSEFAKGAAPERPKARESKEEEEEDEDEPLLLLRDLRQRPLWQPWSREMEDEKEERLWRWA